MKSLSGVQDRVDNKTEAILRHQKGVYDARWKRKSRPYKVGDLVWLEEKAVHRLASYADALWARHAIFLPHERLLK